MQQQNLSLEDFLEPGPRNDRIIQQALRQIDSEILVVVLYPMTDLLRDAIYRNMSPRAQQLVLEDLADLAEPSAEDRERALGFWNQLLRVSAEGLFEGQEAEARRQLPALELDTPMQIVETFVALASFVKAHGLLPLDEVTATIANPLMREGLRALVDGQDELHIRTSLEAAKRACLRDLELKLDLIIDGLDALAARERSTTVEFRLRAHLTTVPAWTKAT